VPPRLPPAGPGRQLSLAEPEAPSHESPPSCYGDMIEAALSLSCPPASGARAAGRAGPGHHDHRCTPAGRRGASCRFQVKFKFCRRPGSRKSSSSYSPSSWSGPDRFRAPGPGQARRRGREPGGFKPLALTALTAAAGTSGSPLAHWHRSLASSSSSWSGPGQGPDRPGRRLSPACQSRPTNSEDSRNPCK
jgi:hypothetical protein